MTDNSQKQKSFEDFNVAFNQTKIETLFKKYEEIGFIYPAKRKVLKPHFAKITKNWEQLLKSNDDLLWILTNEKNTSNQFASISVWKNSNFGLFSQHLVSNGNPFLSLKTMLAAQFRAEHHYNCDQVKSSQNWFRPNNRYAYRIFASMFKKLGPKKASLIPFHYLFLDQSYIATASENNYFAEEVKNTDLALNSFIKQQYGEVFLKGEELTGDDIQLLRVGHSYEKIGLKRSRKIFKIINRQSQKIVACIIGNRAPIGLNFSFLENRAYFILDNNMALQNRVRVLKTMTSNIKSHYEDFELNIIPIVTDATSSSVLQNQNAVFLREYMQSIWMREGFALWYNHIDSFLQKIEKRTNR